MKVTIKCDIWTGEKVEVAIDRETGEFSLFNASLKLNIQGNKAVLIDEEDAELLTGYLQGKTWRFEEPGKIIEGRARFVRENEDPYVAVIQLLHDIIYVKMSKK